MKNLTSPSMPAAGSKEERGVTQKTISRILNEVTVYADLQKRYKRLCEEVCAALPAGNPFFIEFLGGDSVSRRLTIVGEPVAMDFGIIRINGHLAGKLSFQKIVSPTERKIFLMIYFDALGNTYGRGGDKNPMYVMSGDNITEWLLPSVTQNYLLSPEGDVEPVLRPWLPQARLASPC
jgi:hypothetical protein